MTDFSDRMMDFIFENEVHEDTLTGEQYLKAVKAFPSEEFEVYEFFREWVWGAWQEKNLPTPEIDEAESSRIVEEAWQRFKAMLEK